MAPLWWRDIFRIFCVLLCVGMTPQTVIGLHSVWIRYKSPGHSSVSIRECVGRLHAIRCYVGLDSVLNRSWIGVRLADICPMHNRSKTDKPFTIGGRINSSWPGGLAKMGHFYHHTDVTKVLAISRRLGCRLWTFNGANGLLRVLTFNF